jgi:hypothetical protein
MVAVTVRDSGRHHLAQLSRAATIAVLLAAAVAGCSSHAPAPAATPSAQVPTYDSPSSYRVGESSLRQLVDELDPDSPQRQILADGHVTEAELQRAWQGYADCIRTVGYTVSTPVRDPVGNVELLYTYRRQGAAATPSGGDVPMTDAEAGRIDDCEARFWFPVSAIHTADTPDHLAPLLADALVRCMAARGHDVRGSTTFGEVVGAKDGHAEGARVGAGRECLTEALAKLYPDLPYHPQP